MPRFLRGLVRWAHSVALRELRRAYAENGDVEAPAKTRAWTLLLLLSRMLLHRPAAKGGVGRQELLARLARFEAGEWTALIAEAAGHGGSAPTPRSRSARPEKACAKVHLGEASHARRERTAAALAPGSTDTLEALQDPERRPPEPTVPLPADVLEFLPAVPLELDKQGFLKCLRSAIRGVSGGMSGSKYEHLKICLELEETAGLLADAAQHLAQARVPAPVVEALRKARLTALTKRTGGVRGIATGELVRFLVARTLAQQYGKDFTRRALLTSSLCKLGQATTASVSCCAP